MSDAEWRAWRKGGLGASDVAAVVGLSPWVSPWALYAEKVGLTEGQDETRQMRFGKYMEPALRLMFEAERPGMFVAGEQTMCTHPDEPWMRCTVDGFVFESPYAGHPTDAVGVYEAKTAPDAKWDEIPAHYQAQGQWQMAVTGLSVCWFGVLHLAFGRTDYQVYELARDDNDIALLIDRCRTFWFDHVCTGTPPPVDAHPATTRALAGAWEADDTESVEADDRLETLVGSLHNVRAGIAHLTAREAELTNAIKAALGQATTLTHGVGPKGKPVVLVTWKPQQRTSIDTVALKAEMPEVAAKFTRTTETRVFRVKETTP